MLDSIIIPRHVGIIPDGNRRWARSNFIDLPQAYGIAMQKLSMSLDFLFCSGVSSISIFMLSRDNLLRQRDDLSAVLTAEEEFIVGPLPPIVAKHRLCVMHAGVLESLPTTYAAAVSTLCGQTWTTDPTKRLFLCIAYDVEDELSQQPRGDHESLTIWDRLWVREPVDLVIRTGGDQRLSGFLPIQCKYAELYITPYYFPDIDECRLQAALDEFSHRMRRFGT